MSFSNEVKAEIISAVTDKDKKFACLYGLILFCNRITRDEICFQSENQLVAETFSALFAEIFKNTVKINEDVTERKNGTSLYSFTVTGRENVKVITDRFRIDPEAREIDLKNIDNNSMANFLAGVFLSCGSVNNPENGYHLEFVIGTGNLCEDLNILLNSFDLKAKTVTRKNNYILYIKESENIEEILTFMGAQNSTLEIMNIKILKDMRNRVNRVRNCDMANLNKTSAASVSQLQDIRLIESRMGLENLPDTLREIAEARLENPEFSLNDLGEILDPPIGRSGVNHRLKRIKQIADQIRKENNE
ncbi:DNA-binding protein WhiA [Ruminococcus sp. HUN007]|uniref:DNA-binding protein WhiA n=1 Tax=Ruminococcus sp. HUN007 TaxID=1514668 RepID=UPI0005D1E527|nr:DNA-binding protein WhiA [Ruminococcus sp. HUN007]